MAISKITENGLTITDLTVADDLTVSDDLLLASDGAILKFGADADVTLTHVHNTGLTLNDALTTNDNITISEANPELFLASTGDGGEGSIGFKDDDGNIDGKIAYRTDYSGQTDNYMTFNTNGSNERMRIDDSGNVAIGNTSPSSQYMTRLVVGDGSGTEGITVYSGNDSQGRLEFSDATSGDGRYAGGVVYNHSTNKLRFNTNGGNERLSIDSNGYVNISQQPSISVDGNTSSAVTDSGSSSYLVTQWTTSNDSSFYSQGITYDSSNGRFTVPVAGKYLINVSIYTYQNNVFQRVQLYINGSNNLHYSFDNKTGDGDLGQDNSLGGSTIFNLSANDYIQVYMYKVSSESNKRYYFGAGHSSFSMHLLS